MNKKINVPGWLKTFLILVGGIFLGWLLFRSGGSAGETHEQVHAHEEGQGTIWTCSMHPQIRQSEPGKCPLCGMDLIPLVKGSGEAQSLFVNEMTPEAVALANIRTTKVKRVEATNELRLTGKIQANEQRLAVISSNFSGRVERLYVSFTGQEVKRGEKLATVYSPELITAQKELLEAARTKDINPALYQAAREKLRLWKITDAQMAAIERSGEVKPYFDVFSDASGIVTARNVTEGDFIARGTPLFEIADLSQVWVLLDAYERDLAWIKKGATVDFTVAAVPGERFKAKIAFIDPVINPATRAASVRAETSNPNRRLKPEMFVNATVTTQLNVAGQMLAIPHTALLWTGKRSVVYVKVPDADLPTFELREIILGPRTGDVYLVESGLEEGEEVVANGVFAVDAAAQLSGNHSMMSLPQSKTLEVDPAFQEQLTAVTEHYFNVKNALAGDNAAKAAEAAQHLVKALGKVDMRLLKDKAHDEWMNVHKPMQQAAQQLSASNEIEKQREQFLELSQQILKAVEVFGVQIDKVYRAYCPMAFDNLGAFWLSEVPEILNPYFGESMLNCGEVKETFRRGNGLSGASMPQGAAASGGQHNH